MEAGIRSTKAEPEPLLVADAADVKTCFNKKEKDIYVRVWDPTDTVHSNQTGKFPVRSRKGNNYMMIMCHVDSDAAMVEPMKNRSAREMIRETTIDKLPVEVMRGVSQNNRTYFINYAQCLTPTTAPKVSKSITTTSQ